MSATTTETMRKILSGGWMLVAEPVGYRYDVRVEGHGVRVPPGPNWHAEPGRERGPGVTTSCPACGGELMARASWYDVDGVTRRGWRCRACGVAFMPAHAHGIAAPQDEPRALGQVTAIREATGVPYDGHLLPDGTIALRIGAALHRLTAEQARHMQDGLGHLAYASERRTARLRGEHMWIFTAALGGVFVRHAGKERLFVTTKLRRAAKCSACARVVDAGKVVYRQDDPPRTYVRDWWIGRREDRLCGWCVARETAAPAEVVDNVVPIRRPERSAG